MSVLGFADAKERERTTFLNPVGVWRFFSQAASPPNTAPNTRREPPPPPPPTSNNPHYFQFVSIYLNECNLRLNIFLCCFSKGWKLFLKFYFKM